MARLSKTEDKNPVLVEMTFNYKYIEFILMVYIESHVESVCLALHSFLYTKY